MSIEIKVPPVGESITEVVLSSWKKADGDFVEMDEIIAELESDKATFELTAEKAGILKISAKEGDTLEIGATVCSIEEGAAPAAKAPAQEAAPITDKASPAATETKTANYADGVPSPAAAKILVALFAGLFTSIITSLISLMLTSKVSIFLVCLTSATFSILTFSKSSDYGILAKTLGVITLILLRRVKTANFFSNFIKFLTASMNLSTRKNYPPTDNPWSYKEVPGDPNYIPFNMYSTILSVMLIQSILQMVPQIQQYKLVLHGQ